MKRSLIFLLGVGLLATCFGSYTFASFSVTDKADPFSVRIIPNTSTEEEPTYFIKTFENDAVKNTYELVQDVSVTSHKEYKLSGISLSKGEILKGYSSDDKWYDNFSHCWSGTSINKDGYQNYIVPMTSNSYSFKLKLFSNGTHELEISAEKDVLFYKPNSQYASDGARFALYLFGQDPVIWRNFSSSKDGYYKVDLAKYDSGGNRIGLYNQVIICRMNGSTTANNWDNKWNQSGDITIANFDPKNAITNTNGWSEWDAGNNSSWSTM